jgi:hypothetical protein
MLVHFRMGISSVVLMQMGVSVQHPVVLVWMGMKVPLLPPDQESNGEEDNDRPNRHLRNLVDRIGQVAAEKDNRKSEKKKRGTMTQAPGGAEDPGASNSVSSVAEYQGRHRGNVIRVGGMAEAQQDGHEKDGSGSVPQLGDPLIKGCH